MSNVQSRTEGGHWDAQRASLSNDVSVRLIHVRCVPGQ